ncbi:MAG TPA: RpiB/LacA/LacB family sugar-phosphate isomerase [Patescibacteria group bacterium]|nr:RpiB/LacA/LacB family sugar-phosphate isomerase [Patescibacteria group bacterium]
MKIYLAADHAGFDLKEEIRSYLLSKNWEVEDLGNFKKVQDDDYPDWISLAAEKVSNDEDSRGIVFGRSGEGEAITANKFKNIRAVVGFNSENVRLTRLDNDANVLSLGSEFVNSNQALELVEIFLRTQFSKEERHIRRISKIKKFEH